jgi:hypothetical protein
MNEIAFAFVIFGFSIGLIYGRAVPTESRLSWRFWIIPATLSGFSGVGLLTLANLGH